METHTMVSDRKKKSEKLARPEHAALKQYRKKFDTEVDCAISLGIDRVVLNRVILKGSGAPDTIAKIRAILPVE
jgi:hypothetical protein